MRFLRVATGYKMPDYKQKEGILKEVWVLCVWINGHMKQMTGTYVRNASKPNPEDAVTYKLKGTRCQGRRARRWKKQLCYFKVSVLVFIALFMKVRVSVWYRLRWDETLELVSHYSSLFSSKSRVSYGGKMWLFWVILFNSPCFFQTFNFVSRLPEAQKVTLPRSECRVY